MRSLPFAVALMTVATANAFAEEKASDDSLCFMATAASDYRFRGISQTRLKPALQAGADYVNRSNGWYAGTWASSVRWIKDMGGNANVEWDIYGGKKGQIGKDGSYDVGVLTYIYSSNDMAAMGMTNANTTEVYGQLGYGPFYARYSHTATNAFGYMDSRNSGYLDLGANIDAGNGYTINLHGGRQVIRNNSAYSYNDWKVGATRDFSGFTFGLAAYGTNTDAYMSPAPAMKNLGRTGVVLTVTKMFM